VCSSDLRFIGHGHFVFINNEMFVAVTDFLFRFIDDGGLDVAEYIRP